MKTSSRHERPNVLVALVFLAVTVIGVIGALTMDSPDVGSDPGPASYPLFVLALMALCSVLLLFSRSSDDDHDDTVTRHPRTVLAIVIALAAYIALLEPLGYVVATALFIAAALVLAGVRRRLLVVGYAIGVPVVLFAIFNTVLGIPLPAGVLGGVL